MADQPTPAHYCPACRTTTPATTAEGLVQAGVDHRAECTGTADLRTRIAAAIVTDLKKAIPPLEIFPGHRIGGMGRTEYDLADAVLTVLQQHIGRTAAEHYRRRWESTKVEARRQAARADTAEAELAKARASTGRRRAVLRATAEENSRLRDKLALARASVRRLNYRAQRAESTVATIARAVRDWQFTERGTYMPLRSLAALARTVGRPVPDGRFELHYQRVEQLTAELDRTHAELATAREHAERYQLGALERAALLEDARDALEAAGMNGAHGDDWPAIAPAIQALAAEVAGAKAAGMRDAAAMLRRYCPDHGATDLDIAFMDCHCPAATEIERDAAAVSAPTT